MSLPAGTRLGPYEILAPLGAGGMGEVYRARDERLGREVAIKVVLGAGTADADLLRRFEQEARAASALNHPGILAVFDVGRHEDRPYVVCELLEGSTLREALKNGPIPPRRALEMGRQVAEALSAAHEKGIVHRDLKPENLFVLRDGRTKILDFGLAKLVRRELPGQVATGSLQPDEIGTRPGTVMGTVGYMSPEQVRGEEADHRSDLFSLGAVLYEMLSGRRAFRGASAVETMNAVLREEPTDLGDPHAGTGTERVVRRCLEKTLERRFQSASDLAFALESLSGSTRSLQPPPVNRRPRRWFWVGGAAVAIALTAGALVAHRTAGPGQAPPAVTRLTFRRGSIDRARFTPDGQSVVYSARWDGGSSQVYITRVDNPQSTPVAVPSARLVAASAAGELLVLLWGPASTLARVPIAGGTPRELLTDALSADWSPDGKDVAAVRSDGSRWRLEYPIGRVLVPAGEGFLYAPRVSPDGALVAYQRRTSPFTAGGALAVVDREGRSQDLGAWDKMSYELGWLANAEILLSVSESGGPSTLHAVDFQGRDRVVLAEMQPLELQDVARDGRLLAASAPTRMEVHCSVAGGPEREFAWFDGTEARALSADGSLLLFDEVLAGGRGGSAWLRPTDGSRLPVRLADGLSMALSPDAGWVVVQARRGSPDLHLVPTGAGETRRLPAGPLVTVNFARFHPDGRRLILTGREKDGPPRLFVQEIDPPRPPRRLGPESLTLGVPSPDGQMLATSSAPGPAFLIPFAGGDPRPLPGAERRDFVLGWTPDGKGVLVAAVGNVADDVFLLDLATGRRTPWKRLMPREATGIKGTVWSLVAADGRSYCYNVTREQNDLHVISGVR